MASLSGVTASINITAATGMLPAALRGALGLVQGFANNAKAALGALNLAPKQSQKAPWVQHAVGQAVGNAASRGIDILIDQGKAVWEFNDKIVRLGIAAKLTAQQQNAIAKAARETSSAVGTDARAVVDSYRAYINLAGAENGSIEKMRILTRTAQASEAAGADLAGMMYQLTRSFKVADGEMENTMGGLINQAKDGAIEAKQMAAEFSGMAPMFARFGVVGREGAIRMGAMYQVARDGFDSAATAATGMIRLMAGIQRNASKFEKAGVHVFQPGSKKELRDLSDIIEQIKKSPLEKDIEKMIKAFGRNEGWRLFELIDEAPERLKKLEEAGRAYGVVQKDLMTITESPAGRVRIAMEKAKNAIAEAFTPERIDRFVNSLEGAIDNLGPVVAAVGKISDGFALIYRLGQRMRGELSNDPYSNPYKDLSPAEKRIRDAKEADERRGGMFGKLFGAKDGENENKISAKDRAEAELNRTRRATFNVAARELAKLQGDSEKPTDEAVRRAIELANTPQSQIKYGGIGTAAAGQRFLDNAPPGQLARVKAEIDHDSLAYLGRIINQAVEYSKELNPHQWAIDNWNRNHPNETKLTVDGNTLAKTGKNATDRRRGTSAR